MKTPLKRHAVWRGSLQFGALACPVALFSAASTEERVAFRTLNRDTGHPVQRIYVDSETEEEVDRDEQVKGYESAPGDYIALKPEEISGVVPASDKVLRLTAFLTCAQVNTLFLDRPYFVDPGDDAANEVYLLICEGLKESQTAAVVQSVLFRRVRNVLIYAHEQRLYGATLNYDYEVVPAASAFDDLSDLIIKGEMLDLAKHIIQTKKGTFEAAEFEDRYDAALAELVKAKIEGREIEIQPAVQPSNVVDLLSALRESAGEKSNRPPSQRPSAAKTPSKRKKTG